MQGLHHFVVHLFGKPRPTSQDAKPRVQPGVHHPLLYKKNVVGEPRVKPGVWRPEMWALQQRLKACNKLRP
jgi:hypothetical protein